MRNVDEIDMLRADFQLEKRLNAELTAEVLRLDAEIYRLKNAVSQLRDANNYLTDQVEAAGMKWVSVDDESPPDNTPVALWDQSKRSQIISECLWIAWEDWHEAQEPGSQISHWMRIEPPASSVGSV